MFVPELQDWLALLSLENPSENELKIIVRKAAGCNEPESPVGRSGWDVLSYPSIVTSTPCYEIYFSEFITYSVTNERHYAGDSNAVSEGSSFRRFTKSKFMDFFETMTYGDDVHPGPRFHYGVYCQNTCIDIISNKAPTIAFLGEFAR